MFIAVDGEIIDVNMTAVLNVERKEKVMPLVAIKNKLKWKWQIFNIAFKLYTIHLKDESQQMPTTKIFLRIFNVQIDNKEPTNKYTVAFEICLA